MMQYDLAGLGRYGFMFVLIWWAWLGHTMYSTRFDSDDLLQRLLTLLQIFAVAVMAANAKDALESRNSAGFGAAYAGMRIVLVYQYARAHKIKSSRNLTRHYAFGFGTAAILWLAAAVAPGDYRFWLWTAAMIIDVGTPLVSFKHSERFPPDAAHLPERFGLFTIILLGESVAAVMRGIESQPEWTLGAAITAFSGLVFVFLIWWWYFDGAQGSNERYIRNRQDARRFEIWSYAHLPLYLAIGIAGVGVEHTIALQPDSHLHATELWIFGIAMAVVMVAMLVIAASRANGGWGWNWLPRSLLVLPVATIGWWGEQVEPALLIIGCTLVVALQLAFSLRDHLQAAVKRELAPDFGD